MPVLASTDRAALPRSVLRHRPIERDTDRGEASLTPVARRASRLRSPQTEEEEQAAPGKASTGPRPRAPRQLQPGQRRRGVLRARPLLLLGLGMLLMLVVWTLLTLAANCVYPEARHRSCSLL